MHVCLVLKHASQLDLCTESCTLKGYSVGADYSEPGGVPCSHENCVQRYESCWDAKHEQSLACCASDDSCVIMNDASARCIATSQIQIAQDMHGWDGRVLEDCGSMPSDLAVRLSLPRL